MLIAETRFFVGLCFAHKFQTPTPISRILTCQVYANIFDGCWYMGTV